MLFNFFAATETSGDEADGNEVNIFNREERLMIGENNHTYNFYSAKSIIYSKALYRMIN